MAILWFYTVYEDSSYHGRLKKTEQGGSDEPFEPLFSDFADGADFRWLSAGTEIPADRTTPDRE